MISRFSLRLCGTPTALISLISEDRQWFKAKVGWGATETARDISFCAHAILSPDVLEVSDALQDPRFRQNPLVNSQPHIRFYAGAPLRTPDGHAIGTICTLDYVPHQLTATQKDNLQILSRIVMSLIKERRYLLELKRMAAGGE